MKESKNVFNGFMKIFEWLATGTLALMTTLISLQVLFRFVLNSPLAWTEELARYTFIWMTFIAGFVAAVRGEHVAVTMLQERAKGLLKTVFILIANGTAAIFFAIVGYYSLSQWTKLSMQTSAVLKIPINHVYLGIIVGSFCMAAWYFYLGVRGVIDGRNEKKSASVS